MTTMEKQTTQAGCDVEWREANGLPLQYCVTHDQDWSASCGEQKTGGA